MSFLSASDIMFAWKLAFFLYEKCFTRAERAGEFLFPACVVIDRSSILAIPFLFPPPMICNYLSHCALTRTRVN